MQHFSVHGRLRSYAPQPGIYFENIFTGYLKTVLVFEVSF
jgi:hypothetical protein